MGNNQSAPLPPFLTGGLVHVMQRKYGILLGLRSAKLQCLQSSYDTLQAITAYTKQIQHLAKDETISSHLDELDETMLPCLWLLYERGEDNLNVVHDFICNNGSQANWQKQLLADPQLHTAIRNLREIASICALLKYVDKELLLALDLAQIKLALCEYLSSDAIGDNEQLNSHDISVWLPVLSNGLLSTPQELKFSFDHNNPTLDLATLSLSRPNICKALNEFLSTIDQIHTVIISNLTFNNEQVILLDTICAALSQVPCIDNLTIDTVNITGNPDQIARCVLALRNLHNVTNFHGFAQYSESSLIQNAIVTQQHLHNIAAHAWYSMRQQVLNYRPCFIGYNYTERQVRSIFKDPNPALFRDPMFLAYLNNRIHHLHPATRHALYLKAVVLNNTQLVAFFQAHLENAHEIVSVKCDDDANVFIGNQAHHIIDATVLTRYGAKIVCGPGFSFRVPGETLKWDQNLFNNRVVRRCKTATRAMLLGYRQHVTNEFMRSRNDLEQLDMHDAITVCCTRFNAHNVKIDSLTQRIMSFLPQSTVRTYGYQPLRQIYDKHQYNADGSVPESICSIS